MEELFQKYVMQDFEFLVTEVDHTLYIEVMQLSIDYQNYVVIYKGKSFQDAFTACDKWLKDSQ